MMPHLNIKHFPRDLAADERDALVEGLVQLVTQTFACADTAVSVALEPVTPEDWRVRVVDPELHDRGALLIRRPGYDFS
jgi:4-oxalocrotonate tautomerase